MPSDQSQLQVLRAKAIQFVRRYTATQGIYRLSLSVLILVFGLLAVRFPLGMRLENARAERDANQHVLQDLQEVQAMLDMASVYSDRLTESEDMVFWQDFVQAELGQAGGRLVEFTPGLAMSSGNFKILNFEIRANGTYSQLVDFVHRVQRSEHLIRIDDLGLEVENARLTLSCTVRILTGISIVNEIEAEEAEA